MAGNNIIITAVAENNIIITATINGQTIDIQVPSMVNVEITPNPLPYVQQNANWDSVSGVTEILNKPTLGTASALNVPVSGNASPTEVVLGSDTRLSASGVTSVTATSPILSSGGLTPNISIPVATSSSDGYATSTQISKLDGIASGAEVNVNADWNSVAGDSQILNKPTIPTQYTDELAQDAVGGILTNTGNVQFVYDDVTPKITASVDLSGKQNVLGFTPVPDTRTVNGHALTSDVTVSKTDVGLSNVDNTSDANKPISSATQTALDGKVDENLPITGATKTKITYDAKGLVTSGADATTSDIADSLNKRYVTDANLTTIGNQSGTNTGDNSVNSLYSGLATSKQDADPTLTALAGLDSTPGFIQQTSTDTFTKNSNVMLNSTGLLLDQTSPQTISNGSPIFNDGAQIRKFLKIMGLRFTPTIVTGDYIVLTTDWLIICNSISPISIFLLPSLGNGQTFKIKNVNTGVVTVYGDVTGTPDLIDGDASFPMIQWDMYNFSDYAVNNWAVS
jgi:hypothetical protein